MHSDCCRSRRSIECHPSTSDSPCADFSLDFDTVQEFMWQDDLVGVAKFANDCLYNARNAAAGPSHDGQASDHLDVAGRDVK